MNVCGIESLFGLGPLLDCEIDSQGCTVRRDFFSNSSSSSSASLSELLASLTFGTPTPSVGSSSSASRIFEISFVVFGPEAGHQTRMMFD